LSLFDVVQLVNLSFGAVLVGGLVMEAAVILPLVGRLGPRAGLQAMRILAPRALAYQPACSVGMIASGLVLLLLGTLGDDADGTVVGFLTAAIVLGFMGAAASLGVYLPAERTFRGQDDSVSDEECEHSRRRFRDAHYLRAVPFWSAFLCFVVAALLH
jgi:hypothetical protein